MVITDKENNSHTIFSLQDAHSLIEEKLGSDIVQVLDELYNKETSNKVRSKEDTMVKYIEDGIFAESIRESNLVEDIFKEIIGQLIDKDYIKKTKLNDLKKFDLNDAEIVEMIDCNLHPYMLSYFKD